ncbi:MAG TPA: CDP-archaeol synthase [Candidatus Binatia bacterium]|nr:CDP-archaeol synthase [Candidatus Binatia bacterium]
MIVAQVLWLALPVILGGLVHVAVIKLAVLPGLARLPLDGGLTVRGRRLLGDNKTVRGAVAMIGATAAFVALQAALVARAGWARTLSLVDFRTVPPLVWGLVLGGGYVVGELPNSFVKRQLDVPPGGRAAGALAPVFWLFDEVDSLAGVLLCMPAVWTPPVHVALLLAAVALVVHPAVDLLMMALHLKGATR